MLGCTRDNFIYVDWWTKTLISKVRCSWCSFNWVLILLIVQAILPTNIDVFRKSVAFSLLSLNCINLNKNFISFLIMIYTTWFDASSIIHTLMIIISSTWTSRRLNELFSTFSVCVFILFVLLCGFSNSFIHHSWNSVRTYLRSRWSRFLVSYFLSWKVSSWWVLTTIIAFVTKRSLTLNALIWCSLKRIKPLFSLCFRSINPHLEIIIYKVGSGLKRTPWWINYLYWSVHCINSDGIRFTE